MGTATHRLFLALWPDASVRAGLREHMAQWRWSDAARLGAASEWHVTLHFLGPVADERLDELRAGLAVDCEPFDWVLDRPELWPHGLAVLGCQTVPQHLLDLHRRLGLAVQRLQLPLESRSYRPHVTLARHAQRARPPLQVPAIPWAVRGYVLARSTGEQDSRYEILQQYPSLRP